MARSIPDDGATPPHEGTLLITPTYTGPDRRRAPRPEDASIPSTDRHILAADRIKGLARRTFNKNVLSEIGGFAGLFALDAERFPDPVLVASTDGVGSKLQLAPNSASTPPSPPTSSIIASTTSLSRAQHPSSFSTTLPQATSTRTSSSRSSPDSSTPARQPAAPSLVAKPPRHPHSTHRTITNSPAS